MQAPARITSARAGLQADDLAPLVGGARPVELDLAVDLGAVEHGSLDDVGVVRREAVPDGGEVRDGAAHADERVRPRPPVEPREVGRDRLERRGERLVGDDAVEAEALGDTARRRRRR